jgi:hypothetical protein
VPLLVTTVGAVVRVRHLTSLGFGSHKAVYARQGDALWTASTEVAARRSATQPEGRIRTADLGTANIIRYYAGRVTTPLPTGRYPSRLNPALRKVLVEARGNARPLAPAYFAWDAWPAGSDPARAARLVMMARRGSARVAHVELGVLGPAGHGPSPAAVVSKVVP